MPLSAEDLRFEARRFLYGRPTAALDLAAIQHGLKRSGIEATNEELEAALTMLAGLQPAQVTCLPSPLGGSLRWQITSQGVLAYERNQ